MCFAHVFATAATSRYVMDLLSHLSVTNIVWAGASILLVTYFWLSRHNPKCPPCPMLALPLFGHLLRLTPDPREQFKGFRKQCGDIYSLYLGPSHVVILNGYDVAKEAFVKLGDDFSDRAVIFVDYAIDGANKGIGASNGAIWREHRTFSTTVLRNFGLGKNILTYKIQEEVNYFIELLESFKGQPKDILNYTTISVSNIMCSMIAGQRYDYHDKEFMRILEIMKFNLSKIKGTCVLNVYPWLRFLPGDLFYCKIIAKNFHEFYDIFARHHIKANQDVVGEPGNFIAAYLQEINKKAASGEKTYLDQANLLRIILDLFLAGTETTATTLGWLMLYMINYPDVQEKIFQEINEEVGLQRPPGMQDKTKLTYLNATIMEVQRLASLVPLSAPRVLPRDATLRGYLFPKGTQILINFDSILHDPKVWGSDAEKFRPERFINKDGGLLNPETWIPFSLGRRVCLGESMAKMEMFLFTSNILQRFKVLPADDKAVPPVKGHFGITHTPYPYEVRLVCRRSNS